MPSRTHDTSPAASPLPTVVLDTNVVLDWLLFRDAGAAALQAALLGGSVRWVATEAMRDELASVLAHGRLARWAPNPPALWAAWDRHCVELPMPQAAAPSGRIRCTDPHDQKFIDLALTSGARWLVSRDRAVLKLARRLREFRVEVIRPEAWAAQNPAG